MLKTNLIIQKDYAIIEHNTILNREEKTDIKAYVQNTFKDVKTFNFKLVKAVEKWKDTD